MFNCCHSLNKLPKHVNIQSSFSNPKCSVQNYGTLKILCFSKRFCFVNRLNKKVKDTVVGVAQFFVNSYLKDTSYDKRTKLNKSGNYGQDILHFFAKIACNTRHQHYISVNYQCLDFSDKLSKLSLLDFIAPQVFSRIQI